MNEVIEAIRKRRSIRRFTQEPVPRESVLALLDAAVLAPSAANNQVLRYCVVETESVRNALFRLTAWAGHVKPRRNPVEGETSPMLYIVVSCPKASDTAHVRADAGAAVENMLLTAVSLGFGGCWLGAFDREKTAELIHLPPDLTPLYVIAFGKPAESPVSEEIFPGDDTKYYLDAEDVLHVPKYSSVAVTDFI